MLTSLLIPVLVVLYLDAVCMDGWKLWWSSCAAKSQTFNVHIAVRPHATDTRRVLRHGDVCAPSRPASVTRELG